MFLILVAGVPASGKSTYASYLGRKLRCPVISKDKIKEKLFDTVGFNSREEKRKLDVCATEVMYMLAEADMKAGINVILDNNFENSSVPSLEKLLSATGATPITVRFQGDMEIIYNRFVRRDSNPRRHRGHVVNTRYPEIEPEKYIPMGLETFISRYTDRGMTTFSVGKLITVDCTVPGSIDYYEVTKKVRELIRVPYRRRDLSSSGAEQGTQR